MNNHGKSSLHYHAEENNVSQVKELLSKKTCIGINIRDIHGRTPLHLAANKNRDESHLKEMKILLKRGANVNARDNFRRTPLWFLVRGGNAKIIQLFLKFKADVRVLDKDNRNLLCIAAHFNKNVEVVKLLVDLGLDVNHCANNGVTPLHEAATSKLNNKIEVIKILLKNNANVNAVDHDGYTPLIEVLCCRLDEKNTKKVLKFMMEQSDFSVVHNNLHILTFNWVSYPDYLCKMIIEHIARLHSSNISMHASFLNTIHTMKGYNEYFNQCTEELSRAKITKLKNSWITFYNLLEDDRRKLKNYVGNEDLIEDSRNCEEKFPIYGASIVKNVEKGISRRKLFDISSSLLCECLPIFNCEHLIVRDVLDCIMSQKDLLKFCE